MSTRPHPFVACLAGDGIGPEVMAEASRIIDCAAEAFGFRVRQIHLPFGGDAIDKHGDPFPPHVRAAVKAARAGTPPRGVRRTACSRFGRSSTPTPTCAPCAAATSTCWSFAS
jgi:hypothetical protein